MTAFEGKAVDAPFNMVSGYNCLTKMDSLALKEKSENFQTELKNALINCDQRKNDKEIQFLKELIVSHLDVIQQQSEQLAIKDRLIHKLKNDKEMLEMRLLRMERRVNLERNRLGDGNDKVESDSTSNRQVAIPGRAQRRTSTDSLNKSKVLPQFSSSATASLPLTNSSTVLPIIRESKKEKRRHRQDEDSDGNESRRASSKLISERLYYTSVGEQECRWGLEPITLQAKPQSLLEVPSWRVRTYSSSYTMEGTENLSDEVFERRHSSLCKDEKRRKRWDVQRIREMRHNEKLRQRQDGQNGAVGVKSESCTESLWPQPTRETQLIVHQSVPVAAFGLTLHSLPQRDFLFSSFTFPSTKSSRFGKRLKR